MADSRAKIRNWGAEYAQLQAEIALIEAEYAGLDGIDDQLLKALAIDKARNDFRARTHEPEPPSWE
jgi:hypothetical protein